jgi:NAD+ synthase
MDYFTVDLILMGFQKGLSMLAIADQQGINEQSVLEIQEMVRLSEHSRNHALAPILNH